MNATKISLLVIAVIIIGAAFYFWNVASPLSPSAPAINTPPANEGAAVTSTAIKTYRSDRFSFAFDYPVGYYLEEKEVGNGERSHYRIMLTEDTEEHRLLREGKAPPRDGPVAISIDLYQNDLDKLSVLDWIMNTSASNFKLSDGNYDGATVGGHEAIAYRWSGLYEADNLVLAQRDAIMSLAVTYIAQDDPIRNDFYSILEIFSLF